ncbi:ATP-binding protein [Streptomyces sp. ST2-7A]|uniref:ATP-binding protein n=1 Tax=Streptomyces sp. ST2-7A TaxID=2907214 RepID=UPI001F19F3B6|nr:ATP-binding protein [Streptomyces sp. ST2-7A]MCE7081556.1 ATP-binding protein [Streptomyces sp. ST2-7A]
MSGEKKQSVASRLVELATARYDLVTGADGNRPYAIERDGPNVVLPLRGKAGLRQRLARTFTAANAGEVPSQSALADAMTVLEGIAGESDPVPVHMRCGRAADGSIVVDLGTADGRCVVVSPYGWELTERSPILFRRSGAMAPMPIPRADDDFGGLERLRALMNIDDTGFRQLVAWMVAAWIPDLPHPILTLKGEQGTGKSKAASMVINLIDPSDAPKRSLPRDVKSWSAQAFNSWALCLDNVSVIPPWLSDTLCKAVTGDGIVDRALYTDDDVVVLSFRRVLAMTTIDAGALAGDLAERLLMLDLELIDSSRRSGEAELDAAFDAARPAILAALFDLLASVMAVLPGVRLASLPRMADFARVLAAVDAVQEWNTLSAYLSASANVAADALEGDPFGAAVAALVERHGTWSGTAAALLELLLPAGVEGHRPHGWPKDATRAGGKLKRLAPLLRSIGINVNEARTGKQRQRIYTLTTGPRQPALPEAAPPTTRASAYHTR